MANFDRMKLTAGDIAELLSLRQHYPFRKWIVVKPEMADTGFFHDARKARRYAEKHAPAAVYK